MKVSVIIPCYNVEDFILDCLNSIEVQTYENLEIICVNDGSVDGTKDKIERFISLSNKNIRLINQENKGAASARNHGLKYATGDYIQFLDSDDLLLKTKIEHQINLAKENNNPDLIIGSFKTENLKGEPLTTREYRKNPELSLWIMLMKTDLGNTCANLFSNKLFDSGIRWNEQMASSQEYELMFQILKKWDDFIFDESVNTVIRIREFGSISKTDIKGKWDRYVKLRVDIINHLKETNLKVLDNDFYQILFDAIRTYYPLNPSSSILYYEQNIPKDFFPKTSAATGFMYVIIFRLFGFRTTERIRLLLKK